MGVKLNNTDKVLSTVPASLILVAAMRMCFPFAFLFFVFFW